MQRIICVLSLLIVSLALSGQTINSEWGRNDQRGAINRIGPAEIISAAGLIKEGIIIELGHTYDEQLMLSKNRSYQLDIPDSLRFGPRGRNKIVYNVELAQGTLSQIGTQFDGLGHVGRRNAQGEDIYYNGFKGSDIVTEKGLVKLGIENVGAFFTRGILIDLPYYKQVRYLEKGYKITFDDLMSTLRKEQVDIRQGDVVLIRTGIGQFWNEPGVFNNAPGLELKAIKWLAQQKVVMIGSDNNAVEAISDNGENSLQGHEELLINQGIYLFENLNLEQLSEKKVYEFAFSYAPLKLRGATSSPGNPIAIY